MNSECSLQVRIPYYKYRITGTEFVSRIILIPRHLVTIRKPPPYIPYRSTALALAPVIYVILVQESSDSVY